MNVLRWKMSKRLGLVVMVAALLGIGLSVDHTDSVAKDDPEAGVGEAEVIDYAVSVAPAVCTVMGRYPTLLGVVGVMVGLAEDSGFSDAQVGEVVALSVLAECPQHVGLLQRIPESQVRRTRRFV